MPAVITPLVMANTQFGFTTGRRVGYIVQWGIILFWSWLLKNYLGIGKFGGISGHRLDDSAKY